MTAVAERPEVGALLRDWRRRRRMSQLELALEAGVSGRHLSFLETGRARPSAEMVLQLAETLDVPLRERNALLLAAGYAPVYGQRDLDEPEMRPVREAFDRVLRGHEPYPAAVVDRHWGMVAGNRSVPLLTEGVAAHLLEPPVNVLRASLHPEGMAPRILNLPEWRAHLLDRLGREAVASGDQALFALHEELDGYGATSRATFRTSQQAGSPCRCGCDQETWSSPSSAPRRPSERPSTSPSPSCRSRPSSRPTSSPRSSCGRGRSLPSRWLSCPASP